MDPSPPPPDDLISGEDSEAALPPPEIDETVASADAAGATRREEFVVPPDKAELRVDLFATLVCDGYSRVFLRKVIADGGVRVDGEIVKPAFKVRAGHRVVIDLPPPPSEGPIPEDIPLAVLWEDEHLVVIDKPPAMVVHPAKGHWRGTLTAALAHHFKKLSDVGGPTRPGIVHRLDRDTSGVIAIAKTNEAHFKLAAQFEAREVQKEYHAIVVGRLDHDRDWIEAPIGYHPYQREKMSIRADHPSSRDASTFYEVVRRFHGFTYVAVRPKTGRTHQIRVHLEHIGHPVLCDKLYAGHASVSRGQLLRKAFRRLPHEPADDQIVLARQALHAHKLAMRHPIDGRPLEFIAPLPADLLAALAVLEEGERS